MFLLFVFWNGCREKQINENWSAVFDNERATVKRFQNASGEWISEKKVLHTTINTLIASRGDEMKALKKQVGNLNHLVEVNKTVIRSVATVTTVLRDTIIYRDRAIHAKTFDWHDRWLNISGTIDDSLHLNYVYSDSISRVLFYKRTGNLWNKMFGPKVLVEQVNTTNPNTTFPMMTTYLIKPEPKQWYQTRGFQLSLSFAAGYLVSQSVR